MKIMVVAAAVLGAANFAACGPKAEAVTEPAYEELGQDAPGMDGPTGWLETDGAGETSAVYRAGPNAVEFSLTCAQVEKTLTVLAEAPATNLSVDSPATLFAGATPFEGKANPVEDSMQVELTLPVTPALLKALAEAKSARVTIGDAFTETAQDDKQALAHLAQSCSILTGIKPG